MLEDRARQINAPYLKRLQSGLPWTIAKWAMSIDGRVATGGGESQWISGETSRRQVHRLRGRVDAILVGMGTVLADDPMLNARLTSRDGQTIAPPRVAKRLIFSRGRLPPVESKLVQTAHDIPTFLFTSPFVDPDALQTIRQHGVHCVAENRSLQQILRQCAEGQIGDLPMTNVMVEGGPHLMASLLGKDPSEDQGGGDGCLIDEIHAYVGPMLLGGSNAPGPLMGLGIDRLAEAPNFDLHRVDRYDQDVRLIYRRRNA